MQLYPDIDADLANGLCLKDCMCPTNSLYQLAKISKFQHNYSQFTSSDVTRILSASRSRCPYSRAALVCSLL